MKDAAATEKFPTDHKIKESKNKINVPLCTNCLEILINFYTNYIYITGARLWSEEALE